MTTAIEMLTKMNRAHNAAAALGLADTRSYGLAAATVDNKITVHRANQIIAVGNQLGAQIKTERRVVWPPERRSEWANHELRLIADHGGFNLTSQGEGNDLVWFEDNYQANNDVSRSNSSSTNKLKSFFNELGAWLRGKSCHRTEREIKTIKANVEMTDQIHADLRVAWKLLEDAGHGQAAERVFAFLTQAADSLKAASVKSN